MPYPLRDGSGGGDQLLTEEVKIEDIFRNHGQKILVLHLITRLSKIKITSLAAKGQQQLK